MSKRFHSRIFFFVTAIAISWLLVGCRTDFKDLVDKAERYSILAPDYHYSSVVWLEEDLIVVRFSENQTAELQDAYLATFNLISHEWRELPMPPSSVPINRPCNLPSHVSDLSRLSNGNLGFTYTCYPRGGSIAGVLYQWEQGTEVLEQLQYYPVRFRIGSYSFSPDMSELIQEEAVGVGLSENLYRVSSDGQMEQIVSHFQRAKSPAWSPDGERIAFIGTETYPGGSSSDFQTWNQMESLLHYPWDIYLMDANGDNLQIILADVRGSFLKWSPQGRYLSFAAAHQKTSGIWVLDTETFQLIRVWPYHTFYDWSPDGQQMAIIEITEESDFVTGIIGGRPIIIDLSLGDQ